MGACIVVLCDIAPWDGTHTELIDSQNMGLVRSYWLFVIKLLVQETFGEVVK